MTSCHPKSGGPRSDGLDQDIGNLLFFLLLEDFSRQATPQSRGTKPGLSASSGGMEHARMIVHSRATPKQNITFGILLGDSVLAFERCSVRDCAAPVWQTPQEPESKTPTPPNCILFGLQTRARLLAAVFTQMASSSLSKASVPFEWHIYLSPAQTNSACANLETCQIMSTDRALACASATCPFLAVIQKSY